MHAFVMHVKNGDGRTNGRTDGKLNSRSRIYLASYTLDMIHVYMMHVSMMHV